MKKVYQVVSWASLVWLMLILSGCTKDYWLADPNYERLLLVYPPMDIHVNTEPPGARVVITSLRNPQVYAANSPMHVQYRPHPYIPSWLLIGKKGYRSTSIRLDYEEQEQIKLLVVLAMLKEGEESQLDMSGPSPGRPDTPGGRFRGQGSTGPGNPGQMLRQMMGDPHSHNGMTIGPRN